ncbi:MAG: PPOX class F420-dependent oxidoreductase [Anaerolineales bacterium]|nr:PPOX class F420-dependent oxidoreductase [Anaerolineales bacterium]
MDTLIPKGFDDLLSQERRAFAYLALVLSDGTPQVTPVWFEWDGGLIVINTARGRVKDKVMRRRPVVAMVIADPANPYRYLQLKGPVVFETEEGAYEQICELQQKYHGDRNYPKRPGEMRVIYKIKPEKMQARG